MSLDPKGSRSRAVSTPQTAAATGVSMATPVEEEEGHPGEGEEDGEDITTMVTKATMDLPNKETRRVLTNKKVAMLLPSAPVVLTGVVVTVVSGGVSVEASEACTEEGHRGEE